MTQNNGVPFIGNTSSWGEINPNSRWGKLTAAAARFDGDTEDLSRDVDDFAEKVDALNERLKKIQQRFG